LFHYSTLTPPPHTHLFVGVRVRVRARVRVWVRVNFVFAILLYILSRLTSLSSGVWVRHFRLGMVIRFRVHPWGGHAHFCQSAFLSCIFFSLLFYLLSNILSFFLFLTSYLLFPPSSFFLHLTFSLLFIFLSSFFCLLLFSYTLPGLFLLLSSLLPFSIWYMFFLLVGVRVRVRVRERVRV
jgi:hypothetical protein